MTAFLHDFILSDERRCDREFETFSSNDQLKILEKHSYLMEQAFTNGRLLNLELHSLSYAIRRRLTDSRFISKLFCYDNQFEILKIFLKLDENVRGDLIGLYPELLQYHTYWSSFYTHVFTELPDNVFSRAMTHRLSDTRLCMECIQKPTLLKKLDRKTRGDILNKYRKLEREIMTALERGTALKDQAQAYSSFVEHHTLEQKTFCTQLYNNPALFQQLDSKAQSAILGRHTSLMEQAIREDRLMELDSATLSAAVGYYVANVKPGIKHDDFSSKPLPRNTASDSQRENILLSIARNPLLLNKLRSGTRLFLFRNLQLSGILDRGDVKNLELDSSIIDKIRNAYRFDLHAGYPEDATGEKYSWSSYGPDVSLLGIVGVGEYSDRFNDQLHLLTYRLPIVDNYYDRVKQDWLKASAEIVITDRNFDPLFDKFGREYILSSRLISLDLSLAWSINMLLNY